ncbi:MAG: hypothetical protein IJY22_04525, partial [Clostridia bacterium]|nr:hypothetical protein [Clostridia bacterium]
MKRVLSLFLAVLMVVAAVPAMALSAAAEGEAATSPYVIYQEDFEALDASLTKYEVLQALGWYVPEAFRDTDAANYAVKVQNPGEADENKVLQGSTVQPGGLSNDGVVTIMGSDMMAIVREGNFTVSYELTYRAGTTNADGYSALIYNFNERDGLIVAEGNVTAYGIAAVRACGTGMNGLFYPRYTAAEFVSIEDAPNTGANVMTNRYSATGAYPSLYARLTGAVEEQGDIRTGSFVMQDVTLAITLDYDYEKGVSVYVNGILVSSPLESNRDANYNTYSWEDFITRNSGYALSLLTKANVVAEIDNILVTAENIGTELEPEEMPELLVTEINAAGTKINGTSHGWAEYLEIYNPTDRYIDLAEYTVTVRNYYYEGDIDSIFTDDRYAYYDSLAYGYLIHLGE